MNIDLPIISLDIETYGACYRNAQGVDLPPQTVFHPRRSLFTDGVSQKDLILTCAITLNTPSDELYDLMTSDKKPTNCPTTQSSSSSRLILERQFVQQLKPAQSMVFELQNALHRRQLVEWLKYSEIIIGMNLLFDLQYLRSVPEFRFPLNGTQKLLDLSVLAYLHDETRPERSLKNLGPVLRTHRYEQTLKHHRFDDPHDPKLLEYNAQDTHNTLLCCAELGKRIHRDFPDSDKLSPYCLNHYSDAIWTSIRMSEAGLAFARNPLIRYDEDLACEADRLNALAKTLFGLPLSGEGSGLGRNRLMNLCVDVISGETPCPTISHLRQLLTTPIEESDLSSPRPVLPPLSSSRYSGVQITPSEVLSNPLLVQTPKKHLISAGEENRKLFLTLLPHSHPLATLLRLMGRHTSVQKMRSTYTYPLLYHQRTNSKKKDSILIPSNLHHPDRSSYWLTYPRWYVTPSPYKDGSGGEGGTKQGRITCKGPAAQTFPPPIQEAMVSRFGARGSLLGYDLSQIELRVAALLSGDSAMCRAYRENRDLHADRAVQIFSEEVLIKQYGPDFLFSGNFTRGERQWGKTVNFADLFRSGPDTMRKSIMAMTGQEFPLEKFQAIVARRKHDRPGLWAWQEKQIAFAEEHGYTILPFTGQSRYFMGGDDAYQVNEIVNFPVQTTAGNLLLQLQGYLHRNGLPELNARNPGVLMNLQVYDAVKFDVRDEDKEELEQLIRDGVSWLSEHGYWAMLQDYYGHEVPLK